MRIRMGLIVAAIAAATACGSDSPTTPTVVTTTAPYSATDLVVGTGTVTASAGNRLNVSYTGWLHDNTKPDAKGKQFDAQASFTFTLGVGQVIKGWDQGIIAQPGAQPGNSIPIGMKVNGQRRLVLPPDLAYGSAGAGTGPNAIPPNATLVFDITLLSFQ